MVLFVHVTFSILGMVGAYVRLFAHTYAHRPQDAADMPVGRSHAARVHAYSIWITWISIGTVIISGLLLFSRDPQTFLDSNKFLSNMAAMSVLCIVEAFAVRLRDEKTLRRLRIASVILWTWIFLVALLVPR